jgi:hypothetical protein
MGNTLRDSGDLDKAIDCCLKAIEIKPNYAEAFMNMGVSLTSQGKLDASIKSFEHAIKIQPNSAEAYNNMGNALQRNAEPEAAKASYLKAIEIKPGYAEAAWNLSGTAQNVGESKAWLNHCLKSDPSNLLAKLALCGLKFYDGDQSDYNELLETPLKNHRYMRSFNWVFGLPELPELYFNRWAFFDYIANKSKKNRPFYEFGVWRGEAFKYLIRLYEKGFGFDTFEGLPEDWHDERAGSYSSNGKIPEIEGGEFIVGKFEDTLPTFFSETRPKASIINFDADLYSSTLCALNFSRPIIDSCTILIFDEFIISENWEQDEYKALNEFCINNNYDYEVMAISFFTKQVAVRLLVH